jgi:poly-gamma-glutamate capsule biosynthesis protein CapA/YwtB (metallophosphatase superfamily)
VRVWLWVVPACMLASSCAPSAESGASAAEPPSNARIVFVGDVMLGRNVAPVVAADPSSVFEQLRPVLVAADVAFANLESPLTRRAHQIGDHALEADPSVAGVLAGAGFDVLALANNHAGDAGPGTLIDTIDALESAGLASVGGGATEVEASSAHVVDVDGVRIGVTAFDMSGGQPATSNTPGVNAWNADRARTTIIDLREKVDVVVVGLHAGVEYLTRPDPVLVHVLELLAAWGADVVWGHGAHVPYPVEHRAVGDRTVVLAPGLGNALFDQRLPRTQVGTALEVLVDREGVVALRTGRIDIDTGRSAFEGWDIPTGDAVALDGDWWTPVRSWTPAPRVPGSPRLASPLPPSHVETARSFGDVTGTGEQDVVIAYRRPLTDHPVHDAFPEVQWADGLGRSAHLAIFTSTGRMRWGSAVMLAPVGGITVCDGSMALTFTTLDEPAAVAGGAWIWDGFGFRTAPTLPGKATPTCADLDRDGRIDPVLTGRGRSTDSTD